MVHTHEHYKPNVIVGYTKTIVSKHKSRGYIVLIIVSVENVGALSGTFLLVIKV